MTEVVLIAHPCRQWQGATELRTAADGWLLGITRSCLLRGAAQRLLEEGHSPDDTVVIRDAAGAAPDLRGVIGDVTRGKAP